ncbi:hypothetical protein Ndes2526A_g04618 [Nannochloris sp. 'desiccata']
MRMKKKKERHTARLLAIQERLKWVEGELIRDGNSYGWKGGIEPAAGSNELYRAIALKKEMRALFPTLQSRRNFKAIARYNSLLPAAAVKYPGPDAGKALEKSKTFSSKSTTAAGKALTNSVCQAEIVFGFGLPASGWEASKATGFSRTTAKGASCLSLTDRLFESESRFSEIQTSATAVSIAGSAKAGATENWRGRLGAPFTISAGLQSGR